MQNAADIVRQARRSAGISQAELARRTGIAQPTISAYERGVHEPGLSTLNTLVAGAGQRLEIMLLNQGFRRQLPTTPTAGLVIENRRALLGAAARHGAKNLRVFGSVARGSDGPLSDIDLLVDLTPEVSLIGLARLEEEFEQILGRRVDVVPASGLRSKVRDSVLSEAVPLEQG